MYIYLRKYLWQRRCFVATVTVINSVIGGFGGVIGCFNWPIVDVNYTFEDIVTVMTGRGG